MTNARIQLAFARKRGNGNHVSPVAPVFSEVWGTSRFLTPLPALGPEAGP